MTVTTYLPAELAMQPCEISNPDTRMLALEAGMARDAAYDALQAYADAVYRELVEGTHHARGLRFDASQADLIARGILSEMGVEMAHDWEYGPTAP
jgi:hypothetical protein